MLLRGSASLPGRSNRGGGGRRRRRHRRGQHALIGWDPRRRSVLGCAREEARMPPPIVVGLTGSIGMGKSTCSQFARDAGVPVFDSDAAVHDLYRAGGAAVAALQARFGGGVLDEQGAVDRAALGRRVLNEPEAMAALEAIVHPLVAQAREQWMREQSALEHRVVIVDIPLLFETGAEDSVDLVVVASASAQVQRDRVLARPGMTEDKLSAILSRQVPDEEKRRRADFIVDTNCSLEETRASLLEFLGRAGEGRGGQHASAP